MILTAKQLHRVAVLLRIAVGCIFVAAGFSKLLQPTEFTRAIAQYQIVTSSTLTAALSIVLPAIEIAAGIGLFFRKTSSVSALVIAGLLIIFIAALFQANIRQLDITCGCFGEGPFEGSAGITRLAQDFLLLAVTLFLYFSPSGKNPEAAEMPEHR